MSYRGHVFLYHAYALAAGGWVKRKEGEYTPLDSVAPSVLSITGGYCSAVARNVNCAPQRKHPFGGDGPAEFSVHIGHAFTEVSGREEYDEDPFGLYRTRVRSILDDFRINDVVYVEHAETVIESKHKAINKDGEAPEAEIVVNESNMSGLRVNGVPVTLEKDPNIDTVPTYGGLAERVNRLKNEGQMVGKGGGDAWVAQMCDYNDLTGPRDGMPDYARDLASTKMHKHVRVSLFNKVEGKGLQTYKSSIVVKDFGRIFLGELFVSHGTKQMHMLRMDLGCDNCGGYGGSGGSTNGTPP